MASQSYPQPVAPPMAVVLGAATDISLDDVGVATVLDAGDIIATATGATATRGIIQNIGSKSCTITNGTLTSGNGVYLAAGESWHFFPGQAPGAICASGETTTLRVVQVT